MKWFLAISLALLLPVTAMATPAEDQLNMMLKEAIQPHSHDFEITNYLNENHLIYTRTNGSIDVIIVHSPQNYLVQGVVHMQFLLDSNGQLTSYSVKEDTHENATKNAVVNGAPITINNGTSNGSSMSAINTNNANNEMKNGSNR